MNSAINLQKRKKIENCVKMMLFKYLKYKTNNLKITRKDKR